MDTYHSYDGYHHFDAAAEENRDHDAWPDIMDSSEMRSQCTATPIHLAVRDSLDRILGVECKGGKVWRRARDLFKIVVEARSDNFGGKFEILSEVEEKILLFVREEWERG